MIFIYTYVTHVIYSNIPSIDEIMDWNIEEIVASSDQLPSQTDIDTKLASLKPNVLSALIDNSYLNPLHEKLATKAELLTSLNSLYCHHPSNEIHFEIKETMAITISNWYTEYRLSYPPESHQAKRRDLDYPIAVLLPVLIQLVFPPQNVEDIIQIPSPPEQNSSQLVPYPAWGGEYNDILQTNTCSIDNIIAIISSNTTTIINSLKLIGTTPVETNFHHIFQLAADCKFQELRDFVAQEIGLEILVDQSGWIKSYDFFASEGYFIEYLRTKDLCNERYFTNFRCHQCNNTFDTLSSISSIGSVTGNIESSVNRHLTPCKCKSCGSTTAIFERLSGQFKSIPVLLPIELGHIVMKDFSVSKIDQHFTISHNEQTLYYKLAGFSICTNKHFYSILNNNGQLCKYDGIRNHLTEPWDYDTFVGTINTVFYLLHSSD